MNILFIPHVPNLKVINRVYEFAKNSNSYFLYWDMDNSNLKNKLLSQIKSFRFFQKDKIVQIPILFKPESFALKFNTYFLNRLIDSLKIDIVINANAILFDIKDIKVPVFYDLVDDHLEQNQDIGLTHKRVTKIKEDIKASKGVICVTEFVQEKAKKLNKNTITIENGLYIEKFKNAKSLKKEFGLTKKKVFGYIGGVEKWTGLKEFIEEYLKIQDDSTALMIVGANSKSYYKELVKRYEDKVLFVGSVDPKSVANYFKTIDIGVIPFYKKPFTDNAFPIKALEYALGGASVVSTPLEYLKYKDFSFINFCEMENFSKCLKREALEVEFDFGKYEWSYLSKKVLDFVGKV